MLAECREANAGDIAHGVHTLLLYISSFRGERACEPGIDNHTGSMRLPPSLTPAPRGRIPE